MPTSTASPTPVATEVISLGSENPVEIAMVLDVSSSMGESPGSTSKLELVQSAVTKLIGIMRLNKDSLGICSFNTTGKLEWAENDKVKLLKDIATRDLAMDAVDGLSAGGRTDMEPGLTLASKMFTEFEPANKAVILLSDGQDNVGGVDKEKEISEGLRKVHDVDKTGAKKVYTVAIGQDADTDLLSTLAGDPAHYQFLDEATVFDAQKLFNQIADQLDIVNVLLNEISKIGSADLQHLTAPQSGATVPVGKTEVLIAIAWDQLALECVDINGNPHLRTDQIAFNVGTVNAKSELDYTSRADLSTEIVAGKGVAFVKILNAEAGARYGVEMLKHRRIRQDVRYSVGVFT